MNSVAEEVIPAPEIRGAIWKLGSCHDTEVGIDGPAGTGKTFGILYYIHTLLLMYPGAKFLVARKYNTDLAGSAMATYRDDVIHNDENIHYFGGNRVRPAAYEYPNGSLLLVNGLDKPGKVKSMEFDGIYINESTECTLDDIEFCRMRLRKGVIPWQQLIMDFNPDAPTHFLNTRMNDGVTTRLESRHEDNPHYWDTRTNDWTEAGRNYVLGVLGGLTGVRLARYRFGIWAAASGTVYLESWERKRNLIEAFVVPKTWPRYLAIDWGYTNPFVCLWIAKDPDGRLFVYRQIYRTRKLVEDHAVDVLIASGWTHLLDPKHPQYTTRPADNADPLPRDVIVDHDAEDVKTFERHSKLNTVRAKKTISDGIQAVASRLRVAGDGKPRLSIMKHSLVSRDEELAKSKKPCCTEEEFDVYIWKKGSDQSEKEEPVDANNHGLDALRYGIAYHDLVPNSVGYMKGFWK